MTPKKTKKPAAVKKVAAPKKEKVIIEKASVRFVSFSFAAVIPTQSFGNVQPSITVEAPSYEEARDFAVPKIEALYAHYAEVKPTFLGKITEEVKVVSPLEKAKTERIAENNAIANAELNNGLNVPKAESPSSPEVSVPSSPVSEPTQMTSTATTVKPEPVAKAERAISLAATPEAVEIIQKQIEGSVKIEASFKPSLLAMCEAKYQELNGF